MRKNVILTTGAILAAIGALSSFVLLQRSPKIEMGPYEALGAVAAEETLQLLGKASQIIVVAQDTAELELPALTAQLKAFETSARKKSGVNISHEKIAMDAMMMMTSGGRMPADRFLKITQNHPEAGAIVLFLGFPSLPPPSIENLKQNPFKIVVIAGFRPDYAPLLKAGVIDLAIVPRPDALPETAKSPQTLREWFDQEYVILKP